MQEKQFDKLMSKDSSELVKAFKEIDNREAFNELLKAQEAGDSERVSELVAENEAELSAGEMKEVHRYIEELEKQGMKKRTIRRKVQQKFGIIIVPDHKPNL